MPEGGSFKLIDYYLHVGRTCDVLTCARVCSGVIWFTFLVMQTIFFLVSIFDQAALLFFDSLRSRFSD